MLQPPPTDSLATDDNVLVTSGEASHRWIRRFLELGPLIPGIDRVRTDDRIDRDIINLDDIRRRIDQRQTPFPIRDSTIATVPGIRPWGWG